MKNNTTKKKKMFVRLDKLSDILTVKQTKDVLGCSDYMVRKLIKEEKIHGVYCGHGYVISKKSLISFLEGE